jgi:hypothetical protein
MIKQDADQFALRLFELAEVFDRRQPSAEMVKGYFAALREYSLPEVLGAMDHALRYAKKFPTPADLLERVAHHRTERADSEHRRRVRDEQDAAKRAFAPSAAGAEQLQRLLARLMHRPPIEGKAWASALQAKARAGQYVPIACQQGAARALGVSLAAFQGRVEAEPAVPVPESEDEREARLEREALMAEGA